MLALIQKHSSLTKETPVLLVSWLSLVAFEDLPEFSELTEAPAEHLIQSLLYRLRKCAEKTDFKRSEETVKVKKTSNASCNINLHNNSVIF